MSVRPSYLGPPLRPDPQSYSALSDYLLSYSYLAGGIISAIILVLVPPLVLPARRFRAASLDDAVPFVYFPLTIRVPPPWSIEVRISAASVSISARARTSHHGCLALEHMCCEGALCM